MAIQKRYRTHKWNLGSESSCDEQESHADDETTLACTYTKCMKQFCLYDELRSRIKSLLLSHRKGDPVCHITMSFDAIYFDGLIRRSKLLATPPRSHSKKQVYTLPTLSKLDDILGSSLMVHKRDKWSRRFLFRHTRYCQVSLKKEAKPSWFPNAKWWRTLKDCIWWRLSTDIPVCSGWWDMLTVESCFKVMPDPQCRVNFMYDYMIVYKVMVHVQGTQIIIPNVAH